MDGDRLYARQRIVGRFQINIAILPLRHMQFGHLVSGVRFQVSAHGLCRRSSQFAEKETMSKQSLMRDTGNVFAET